MAATEPGPPPFSRTTTVMLLVLGVGGLAAGLGLPLLFEDAAVTSEGGVKVFANSLLRIGIVMLALWLALPTLKQPMRWVPPGVAVGCLILIGVIAAQPRTIVVVAPLIVAALSYRWVLKFFK